MSSKHNRAHALAIEHTTTPPPANPTSVSPFTPPASTNSSLLSSISASVIKARLTAHELSASYLAAPKDGLLPRISYHTGKHSDVLVAKASMDSEFILRGVFEITRNDCFLAPDGNFDPGNVFGGVFQDVKLSCRLAAPSSTDFEFARKDFDQCTDNIHRIEKIIKCEKGFDIVSCVGNHLDNTQFKICHALFEARQTDNNAETDMQDPEETPCDEDTVTSDIFGPEFSMETWPTAARCKPYLEELYETHDVCPLPAFDSVGKLIPPSQYLMTLPGATVEVHLSYLHHLIKKTKKHVYVATLRNLVVLRPPSAVPNSPYKRFRISASTNSPGKGKGRV
ncbi:hypothetical protein HD554DRAFT_1110619 [Boletus coccyginus]|nr:hypothetical protein HD554DRAFT_1110619 [Boletus coccyginus]